MIKSQNSVPLPSEDESNKLMTTNENSGPFPPSSVTMEGNPNKLMAPSENLGPLPSSSITTEDELNKSMTNSQKLPSSSIPTEAHPNTLMIKCEDPGPFPPPSFHAMDSQPSKRRKLIGLTFKLFDKEEEVSAIIRGDLSMESTMKDVIDEYSIKDDLLISDIEKCKFLIKKKSGHCYTLKFSIFNSLKVDEFISLADLHNDYIIEIKTK